MHGNTNAKNTSRVW